MEGALVSIKGYLSLREAIIRLAESRAPDVGVRKSLDDAERRGEDLFLDTMKSWPSRWPFDGTFAAWTPASPACGALLAARDEIWQAVVDGDMLAKRLLAYSTGTMVDVSLEQWRREHKAFDAFHSEHMDGGIVLLVEAEFRRWLAGEPSTFATKSDADRAGNQVDPPSPRPAGRPGVYETCLALFNARRDKKTPRLPTQIAEARAIVEDWPEGTPKPQAKTVAGHIAKAWSRGR